MNSHQIPTTSQNQNHLFFCKSEGNYQETFILKAKSSAENIQSSKNQRNFRESDQNPLDSYMSNPETSKSSNFKEKCNNPTKVSCDLKSDQTLLDYEQKNHENSDFLMNNLDIFQNGDPISNFNEYLVYQQKNKNCNAPRNSEWSQIKIPEIELDFNGLDTSNLLNYDNFSNFSDSLNRILNEKLCESKKKSRQTEISLENNEIQEFKSSVTSSISLNFSEDFKNMIRSLQLSMKSLSNLNLSSISDKENTPPLFKKEMKAYAINQTRENQGHNLLIGCELGMNGYYYDFIPENYRKNREICLEVPFLLNVKDDSYENNHNPNIDLFVILALKFPKDCSEQQTFLQKETVANTIKYVCSRLGHNDRFALINVGGKSPEQVNIIHNLTILPNVIKDLLSVYVLNQDFSNEYVDIPYGIAFALKIFKEISNKNTYRSIVIITNGFFQEQYKNLEIEKEIHDFEKMLNFHGFDKNYSFNLNCFYCGNIENEQKLLEGLCKSTNGEFFLCESLKQYKVFLIFYIYIMIFLSIH